MHVSAKHVTNPDNFRLIKEKIRHSKQAVVETAEQHTCAVRLLWSKVDWDTEEKLEDFVAVYHRRLVEVLRENCQDLDTAMRAEQFSNMAQL